MEVPGTGDTMNMIDLERYPLDQFDAPDGQAFVAECRHRYETEGLCLLQGFIVPDALDVLAAEADSVSDKAYFCESEHSAYLETEEEVAANGGDDRPFEKTRVGSVAYDLLPAESTLRTLYKWPPLKDFIAGVIGKDGLHYLADPLGACSINVFRDGGQHGWHFDESEFTVTLMLQQPDVGGAFEYLPMIRGRKDESDQIKCAIDANNDDVRHLPFTPGTLSIFNGRDTLHRVTRVEGERFRLVPVLCYSTQPDQMNSPTVRKMFWGREEPVAAE